MCSYRLHRVSSPSRVVLSRVDATTACVLFLGVIRISIIIPPFVGMF